MYYAVRMDVFRACLGGLRQFGLTAPLFWILDRFPFLVNNLVFNYGVTDVCFTEPLFDGRRTTDCTTFLDTGPFFHWLLMTFFLHSVVFV